MANLSKTLPSDPQARKTVLTNIDEIVDQMLVVQAAKEQIKEIKDQVAEKYETDVVYLANIVYDHRYNSDKKNQMVLEKAEIIEEITQ